MISPEYKSKLKQLAIQSFIKTNTRAPSSAELRELIRGIETKYYDVDNIGISGFDVTKPTFRMSASAAQENQNRLAIFSDFTTLNQKLDNLIDIEDSAYRGATATIHRANKTLDELLSRLDNLLLIYGNDDLFLHGIEETFSHQLFIDRDLTTANVEANHCSLGKRRLDLISQSQIKLKTNAIADKGFLSFKADTSVETLKKDDGNFWKAVVRTSNQLSRVSLIIEITLPEVQDISTLRLSTLPVESNKIMYCTVFYSTNGSSFNSILPAEQRLTPSFILPINALGVKKLQIVISKNAADLEVESEYEYVFLLDRFSLEKSVYQNDTKSVLIAGPYSVVDTSGNPVYFSKATLEACTLEPEGTALAFYLSTDGTSWSAIDHKKKTGAFLSFGDHTPDQALAYVDISADPHSLVTQLNLDEEFDINTEAYLNLHIVSDFASLIPLRNVVILRNIVTDDSADEVLGAAPGWVIDETTGIMSTTVSIDNPEGRTIDLGPKGAILNGQQVTGVTFFPQGYSSFSTDSSNWAVITSGFTNEADLRSTDSLYPYNHRYLIEGYIYNRSFNGQKVYSGVDDWFGRKLSYISPEEFDALGVLRLDVFTIEEVNDKLFFKVKVDKSSSTWGQELYGFDCVVQSTATNEVYVKAILSSNSSTLTPVIESFKVRVV